MTTTERRLLPTGSCWCGCGVEVGLGSFFARGHDKIAEAAILAVRYDGSVAQLVADHGFGPDKPVRQAALESGLWAECPAPACDYLGTPENIRVHRNKKHH